MIQSNFYPTVNQIDANTNIIELTDNFQNINDFTANGLSAYYLGYLNSDNLPYYLSAYIDETSGDNVKLTKVIPDVNPDFSYINQSQNNLDFYSCFLSAYTTQTPFNFNYAYNAINSISPLNTRCASPPQSIILTYSYLIRKWTDPTNPSDIYFYTEYRNINISDMVNFLNGSGTLQFGMALGDNHYEYPNLNISDFDYHNAFTNIYEYSGTYYDVTLMINACGVSQPMFCENNGTATVGGRNSIYPTIHQKIDGVDYIVNAGGARTNGIFNIVNNNSVITIDGKVDYNNYSFFTTSLDFNLSDAGTNFLRLAGENSFVYRNATNSYKVFVAMGWKDIAFSLALLPCLNSTDLVNNCYYPEIIENELTGNFFKYSDLSEYGTDWQKSGEIADSSYSEDDKPSEEEPVLPTESGDIVNNNFNRPFSVANQFVTTYIMNGNQVSKLGEILWTSFNDDAVTMDMVENFWANVQQATGTWDISAVINFIISLTMFPFDISRIVSQTSLQVANKLFLGTGKLGLDISGSSNLYVANYRVGVVDFGIVNIPLTYKDYRDYSNTVISVYLPYCGNVQLNPSDVVGKGVSCKYVIDIASGECLAILSLVENGVERYNLAIERGICGFSIPITSTNAERVRARLIDTQLRHSSNFLSFANSAISTGASIYSKNSNGVLSGILGMINTGINDEIFLNNRFASSGISCSYMSGGTGFTDLALPSQAYVQIKRGIYSLPMHYKSTKGYPANAKDFGNIGDFEGYIECINLDVSELSCSEEEKSKIKQLLETGVYV